MRGGIEVVADLGRDRPEPDLTLAYPAVAAVEQVVAEQPQRQVIATDRGGRPPVIARHQAGREVLHVARGPLPRERLRERAEPAYQRHPRRDRDIRQQPRPLLPCPARDHRLEHRARLVEMDDTRRQRQLSGTRNVHSIPLPVVNLNATLTTGSYQAQTNPALSSKNTDTYPQALDHSLLRRRGAGQL
jgi:hypothetical protein